MVGGHPQFTSLLISLINIGLNNDHRIGRVSTRPYKTIPKPRFLLLVLGHKGVEYLQRQRENNRAGALGGDLRQRLQVAQL